MTPQQIELVQTSFKKVVPIAGTAADLSSATTDGFTIQINFPLVCGIAESTVAIATRATDGYISYRTAAPASEPIGRRPPR